MQFHLGKRSKWKSIQKCINRQSHMDLNEEKNNHVR
jgi:hypothetical protein